MSFSGGVYSLQYNWTSEAASPPIEIAKLDTEMAGIAGGLSSCLLRDGTGLPTASIPFNGQKITGLGNATLAQDAATAIQVQTGSLLKLNTVAGTADVITANLTPTLAAYVTSMVVYFTPAGTNTGAATLNIDGLGAKSIKKSTGVALDAGDLVATVIAVCMYDGTNFVLQNPRQSLSPAVTAGVTRAGSSYTSTTTYPFAMMASANSRIEAAIINYGSTTGTARAAGLVVGVDGAGAVAIRATSSDYGPTGTLANGPSGVSQVMIHTGAPNVPIVFGTNDTARLMIGGTGIISVLALQNFANDAAAGAGGITVDGLYRNGSVVMVRVS